MRIKTTHIFITAVNIALLGVCGIAAGMLPGAPEEALIPVGSALLFPVAAPVKDAPYRVYLEGEELPLAPAGRIEPAYYLRFTMQGSLCLHIEADLPETNTLHLQPRRHESNLQDISGTMTLTIDEPGPRVFMMECPEGLRHTPLIILAEPEARIETPPDDAALFDMSTLAGRGTESPVTQAIQEALAACALAPRGGVVYFGPGTYHTGSLVVGDNTMVYLAPDAVLFAQPAWPEAPGTQPRELIRFDNAKNSGLAGHGVIDGYGHAIRGTERKVSVTLVRAVKSRNLYARDIVMRNAAGWTFHIIGCKKVSVDGVRVLGDWGVANTDGINPDNAQDVDIANVFVYSGDDSLCVKATNRYGIDTPSRNIVLRDSTVMTLKTSLKVGTESRADIENVLFENIDVVHSSRGLALWMRDGHAFSNIVFRDIRMDLLEYPGEAMSGEPFRFCIQDRDGGGHIRNVLVENISVVAPYRAVLTGRHKGSSFRNIIFRDVDWKLTPCTQKPDARPLTDAWIVDRENALPLEGKPLLIIHRAENIVFENTTLNWDAAAGMWDRFVDVQQSMHIDVEGVTHVGRQELN